MYPGLLPWTMELLTVDELQGIRQYVAELDKAQQQGR